MSEPLIVYDFVGIDVETTGLESKKDEIVEITVIEFNRSGRTGGRIVQRCRPTSGIIPADVTAIHGITYEMVKGCPVYIETIRDQVAEFIGDRTVVGHNVIGFDLPFIKVIPKKTCDTLLMCRTKYRSGNKLKSACQRVNIKWDDSKAHSSEYDVEKCIELFCKISNLEDAEKQRESEAPLFAIPQQSGPLPVQLNNIIDVDKNNTIKIGIMPTEKDKKFLSTQTYSYSRLNLFNQCKFKWYMQYIRGIKEPSDRTYFQTGKICHKVAEWAGEWCIKQLFKNKLQVYMTKIEKKLDAETIKGLAVLNKKKEEEVTIDDFANYIGQNPSLVKTFFPGLKNLAELIYEIDNNISEFSYDTVSRPDLESYQKMIEKSINLHKCNDPDVIKDCRKIMERFYYLKDFSTTPGDLTLTEKKLVFDRNWQPLNDFFSAQAFFRGVIDVISYFKDYIVITDYKTSRKMMTIDQLKEDKQTMIYLLLTYMFLPKNSFNKVVIRIEYIRFGVTIEYEINDPKEVADKALEWINNIIQNIEKEMLRTDGEAFAPERNEYCHSCYLGEEGLCPLFNKLISGQLDDPFNCSVSSIDECRAAWKRIETNKSEISRLTKLCKSFIQDSEDAVKIDGKATLDFYATKIRDYDSEKTLNFLLGTKKIDIFDIIPYVSITAADMVKLTKDKNLTLTIGELDSISKTKTKTVFDAFTETEAKDKGFLNA